MSPALGRTVAATVLILHGLGHLLPVLPRLGYTLSDTHSSHSWILSGMMGEKTSQNFGLILQLSALLGFFAGGLALAGWGVPRTLWESMVLTGAFISLLALILFWNGYPFLFPNKIGVIVVDLFVVLAVLWLRWPPSLFEP